MRPASNNQPKPRTIEYTVNGQKFIYYPDMHAAEDRFRAERERALIPEFLHDIFGIKK